MSVLITTAIALLAGLAALAIEHRWPRAATLFGMAALTATLIAAVNIRPADVILIGDSTIAGTDDLRHLAMLWAGTALGLAAVDGLTIQSHAVAGPALLGLGAAVLALAVPDAGTAFALLAAGGVASVLAPALAGSRPRAAVAWRAFRSIVIAAFLGLGVVAWGGSAIGPLASFTGDGAADPTSAAAIGLGLVAVAIAVAVRTGAIPAHLWAARLVEAIPATSVPAALAWGGAAFAVVGLGWTASTMSASVPSLSLERAVVLVLASASILLAGIAAFIHDDLEHIVGYSLVQNAGVTLLAFATVGPESARDITVWVLAYATVTSALAGWVAAIRGTTGEHRLSELGGWARHEPVLAVGFVIAAIAAVGLPGTAAFEARSDLIEAATGGPFTGVLLAGALAPIAYLGRVLVIGIGRPGPAVRQRRIGWPLVGLTIAAFLERARNPGPVERALLAAIVVALLAAVGAIVSLAGV
jgi:NADH:ubiquinone oxidoreductase subunit 2 (subunit N)